MTTILLADDHHVIRQGLRSLLGAVPGFCVVGEAGDGLEALQLIESLQPDVLVLDLRMPGLSGLEVARQTSQRSQSTRVIILSMHDNESYVLEALRHGAAGYVLKTSSADCLVEAVRQVSMGRRYLSPPLTERALEAYVGRAREAPLNVYETLTAREREVLNLVAEGYTSAEIADLLSISSRTVGTHRTNLMRKLDLHSQADLIRYALRRGIPPMDE